MTDNPNETTLMVAECDCPLPEGSAFRCQDIRQQQKAHHPSRCYCPCHTRHQPPAVPLGNTVDPDVSAAQPVECQGCIAAHEGYRIYNHLHTCKESDNARERITQIVIEWERDLMRKGMKPEHLDSLVDRIAAAITATNKD